MPRIKRFKPELPPASLPDFSRLAEASAEARPGQLRPNFSYGFIGLDALDPQAPDVAVDGARVFGVLEDVPDRRGLSMPDAHFLSSSWNLARAVLAIFGSAPVWRPIKTAPEGRRFDVWAWKDDRASRRFIDCRVADGELIDKLGRRFDSPELRWTPTHWIPAPGRPPRRKRGE